MKIDLELLNLPSHMDPPTVEWFVCDWLTVEFSRLGYDQVQVAVKEKQDE